MATLRFGKTTAGWILPTINSVVLLLSIWIIIQNITALIHQRFQTGTGSKRAILLR
jgi:hypothetical protein